MSIICSIPKINVSQSSGNHSCAVPHTQKRMYAFMLIHADADADADHQALKIKRGHNQETRYPGK